jgi:type III pantothenate kinase
MLFAVDVGNSDITIGLWNKDKWIQHWRIASRPDQSEVFYGVRIRDHFLEARIGVDQVEKVVLSSVVPGLTDTMKNVLQTLFGKNPIVLGPEIYQQLPIKVLNPYQIGSDLVANALAAFTKFKNTCIVVDFGTALTFTAISGDGTILGVSIAPGLKTAIRSLSQNAAKLFDVPLEMPSSALGKNTTTAIQSGVLLGYEGLVKNIVEAIQKELSTECLVIATGGLSGVIAPLRNFFYAIDPMLTLDGLRVMGEIIQPGKI